LEKYPNLNRIVYNDINPLNYNFFLCLNDPYTLLDACEKLEVQKKGIYPTPNICRENFNEYQREVFDEELSITYPSFEIAAKYAYILTQVFSGSNPKSSKFIDLKGKYHSKFTSFINKLKNEKWVNKFLSITHVENMDFQPFIEKYNRKTTYFYVDPPYYIVGEGTYYSNHDFGREDHKRLSDTLKKIDGKFSLSYYDFDELSQWFPKTNYRWLEMIFAKAAAAKKGKTSVYGRELLIVNY
jgi:site-specific DNA-adenine methylase